MRFGAESGRGRDGPRPSRLSSSAGRRAAPLRAVASTARAPTRQRSVAAGVRLALMCSTNLTNAELPLGCGPRF